MLNYNYTQEFRTALTSSVELGLAVPNVVFTPVRLYSDDKFKQIIDLLYQKIGNSDGTINLVGQCLNIHGNIRKDVELALGCGAHLTIGYIQEIEEKFFEFSYSDAAEWLKKGIDINRVNLHAWLTLDSMELIDLTWPSTRAKIFKIQEDYGTIITKHPDDFTNALQYHPLIISNDFPIRIGAVHSITIGL